VDRNQILTRLRERIVAFAASRISKDAAEDLGQEVMLLLYEKYAHVEELDELVPLALQIVRFKLMSQRRTAQRRGEYTSVSVEDIQLPDLRMSPAGEFERKQMLLSLQNAIGQLGGRCQRIIRWKLEGRSFADIQKLLHAASINTVYTWDFRCREKLLELLGGKWEKSE
jgi:RNA polymerase sigma-70 factor (ECF subfamily)